MPGNLPNTLGAEFESVITTREEMIRLLKLEANRSSDYRSVTRDASVESPAIRVGQNSCLFMGNKLLRENIRNRGENITSGYEIVTYPLEMIDMRRVISQTINIQVGLGEIFSERSSIHIHAGFPEGLIFLKSAVALGLKIEPLFFKIAGMGSKFRGYSNHAAYCRPLALPPAVKLVDSPKLALLSPKSAIEAEDEESFWGKFGIRSGDRERYNPLRYMGINVFSILLRGTLEFRFFNYCSISKYVEAVAALSQFTSDLMLRLPLSVIESITEVSIFEANPDDRYHSLLDEIVRIGVDYNSELQMKKRDVKNIHELIEKTPQPLFENKPILSHIQNGRISLGDARTFQLEIVDSAEPPGIVDIHNFSRSDRKLLGEI
jgi:hypothetical protein